MKKGKALGISIAVVAVAIVMGIASLPDEVLLESPKLNPSENPPEMFPIDVAQIEIEEPVVIEQPVVMEEPVEEIEDPVVEEEPIVIEQPVEEIEEPVVEEPVQEESESSENNIIEIRISDGVGGGER